MSNEYIFDGMGRKRILHSREPVTVLKAPMSIFFFLSSLDGKVSFFIVTGYPQLRKRRR